MFESINKISNTLFLFIKNLNYFGITLSLICFIGFCHQNYHLCDQYMSGKTVVNIQIGQKLDGIPAITLCLGAVSLDKLVGLSKKFADIYENYTFFVNISEKSPSYKSLTAQIYYQAHDEVVNLIDQGKLTVGELFYNYTADFRTRDNRPRIVARLSSVATFKSIKTNKVNFDMEYLVNSDPEVSVVFERRLWKSYTMFSEMHCSWSDVSVNFTQIILDVEFDINSLPLLYYPYAIIFHSSNDLPLTDRGKVNIFRWDTYISPKFNSPKMNYSNFFTKKTF